MLCCSAVRRYRPSNLAFLREFTCNDNTYLAWLTVGLMTCYMVQDVARAGSLPLLAAELASAAERFATEVLDAPMRCHVALAPDTSAVGQQQRQQQV